MANNYKKLKSVLLELYENQRTICEFESWVYDSDWLETELTKDEYLALISLDYSDKNSKNRVFNVLNNHFTEADFQTRIILSLLNSIISKDGNEIEAFAETYNLYCSGYYFLDPLALPFGLNISIETSSNVIDELLQMAYLSAKAEAGKIYDLLSSKTIELTGTRCNDLGRWQFIDHRPEQPIKLN